MEKHNLRKKNEVQGITLADIKSYYKNCCNQDNVALAEGEAQIPGEAENTEIDSHKYAQLIFDKCVKAILCRKDNLFNRRCYSN